MFFNRTLGEINKARDKMEKIIIDADRFLRTISRISHEIIEKHQDFNNVILVGVKRRGAEIAELIQRRIEELNGVNIQGKEVILIDDVLFTGRTIRAAMDALTDFGRAAKIELVILVDRGHRELPIRADYVGKNVPTSRDEQVQVRTLKYDGCYEVALLPK